MTDASSAVIAVPTEGEGGLDARRSAHFGHAPSFTLVSVEGGAISGARTVVNPPHTHGGCGMTVALLAEAGATAAIVVGMGGGPRAAMASNGIEAYFDDAAPTPRLAVEAWIAGPRAAFGGEHACRGH